MELFEGRVTLGSCVFISDRVELGLEEVEAETEGEGGDKESAEAAGDEVEEELVETK